MDASPPPDPLCVWGLPLSAQGALAFLDPLCACVSLCPRRGFAQAFVPQRLLPSPASGGRAPVLSMLGVSLVCPCPASRFLSPCSHSPASSDTSRQEGCGSFSRKPRCRRVFQAPCTSGRTPLTHLLQASAADLACRPLLGVGGHQGDRFRAQILHLCVTPPERPPCRFQLSRTLSCRQ